MIFNSIYRFEFDDGQGEEERQSGSGSGRDKNIAGDGDDDGGQTEDINVLHLMIASVANDSVGLSFLVSTYF